MMPGVEAKLEGTTLVMRIPMRFQRRGGRKRIVAPDGSELAPTTKPQPDGTLIKALARAWRWQRMLDEGFYGSITQVAEAESLNPSYVSRILRLTLLAPQIVEVILGGHQPSGIQLQAMLDRLPASWATQMALLAGDAERSLGTGPSRNGTLWSRAGRELRNEAGQGMTKHRVAV